AFAEFERSMIRTRVNAGLKRAKDEIKRKGHFVTKHGESGQFPPHPLAWRTSRGGGQAQYSEQTPGVRVRVTDISLPRNSVPPSKSSKIGTTRLGKYISFSHVHWPGVFSTQFVLQYWPSSQQVAGRGFFDIRPRSADCAGTNGTSKKATMIMSRC